MGQTHLKTAVRLKYDRRWISTEVAPMNAYPLFCIVLLGILGEKFMASAIAYFLLVGGAIAVAYGLFFVFRSIKLI